MSHPKREITEDFEKGCLNALVVSYKACKEYSKIFNEKLSTFFVTALLRTITKDSEIDGSLESFDKCASIMDDVNNGSCNTFDEGVIFGINLVIKGFQETEADPELLAEFIRSRFPVVDDF